MKEERRLLLLLLAVVCLLSSMVSLGFLCKTASADDGGPCLADLDRDGDVDGSDLSTFIDYLENSPELADLDGNPATDNDTAIIADEFGRCDCPVQLYGVTPIALPSFGAVPLDVAFSANVLGGIPPYSFAWDLDGDGNPDAETEKFHYLFVDTGIFNISLTVTDSEGSVMSGNVTVTAMLAPEVQASATPVRRDTPPLAVSFSCSAADPDSDIALYQWDFDGDGTFDYSSTESCACSHTYQEKGAFAATVKVTDTQGLSGEDTIYLYAGSRPDVLAHASPKSGASPLAVAFSATTSDSDGSVELYQWDFDGDGTFDWSSSVSPDVLHTYNKPGLFNATLRVTDNDGIYSEDTVIISIAGPPIPMPSAYPLKGNAPLRVTFFADGEDFDGSPDRFQWDFDGDGTFDWTNTDTVVVSHTYNEPGIYHPVLRVIDNQGLYADKALTIEVMASGPLASLSALPGASPPNGPAPLEVHLMGDAIAPYSPICQYQWDFDGDGTFDWSEAVRRPEPPNSIVISVTAANSPAFADLDNDGDFDLVVGDSVGKLHLYINSGSGDVPDYHDVGLLTDSSNRVIEAGFHSHPVFGDMDGDGDLDLMVGKEDGTILYFENRGDAYTPSWHPSGLLSDAQGNPLHVDYDSFPALADIDGDSDLDLLVGDYFGQITLFVNRGRPDAPCWAIGEMVTDVWGTIIDVGYYSAPRLVDIDSDSDLDLLIGADSGRIYQFINQGGPEVPVWEEHGELVDVYGDVVDTGYYSRPFFIDMDGDGDLDMFAGAGGGYLFYYANTGSERGARWKLFSNRYNLAGTDYNSAPCLKDVDHDGDLDLFIGSQDGTVSFFRNNGTAALPVWTPFGRLDDVWANVIDAGENSRPDLADIDADGDYDLVIGTGAGAIYLSRNQNTPGAPAWHTLEKLVDSDGNEINPGPNSKPVLVDIDQDSDLDLFVGIQSGKILFYRNDGTPQEPLFVSAGSITDIEGHEINAGTGASPAFDDWDKDGDYDLFVGTDAGKVFFYRNEGGATAPLWKSEGQMQDSSASPVEVAGNAVPVFGDIDADGDPDLFVGEIYGSIVKFSHTGSVIHRYSIPGTYDPVLKVTDCSTATASDSITVVVGPPGAPSARASLDPVQGTGPLEVHLYGSATDPDGTISLYEWDFDGDGTFDWNSTATGDTVHIFENVGVFQPVFRATDNEGKTITQTLDVRIEPNVHASCSGSVNPSSGVAGTISTTLGAGARVTIRIVDQQGNVVRTLIDGVQREAGDYEDSWDGLNDESQVVRDGVYFFVVEIDIAGETWTYDMRKSAPYSQIVPNRQFPTMFAPYENEVFPISYSLAKPSAVSLYIRTWGTNGNPFDRVKTLLAWEYRSAGDHVEIWDGTDDQGVTVPPGLATGVTLWAWELPDNAMVVTGNAPVVSDVAADSNYFSPAINPYAAVPNNKTVIWFNLSKPADVVGVVKDENGLVVRRLEKRELPAGRVSLVWDGRDEEGNLLAAGKYTVGITATDSHGNRSYTRHASLVLFY